MIAVLFELEALPGQAEAYLAQAAALQSVLAEQEGLISVERFQSLGRPGRYLSLSLWRDEAAVARWRQQMDHRAAQRQGRGQLFADYRLRVAQVLRDYGLHDRAQAPQDSRHALG
ncbi:antibiotic biosynthesis monooxygenase family protein [Roseateles flavus]|uniref:Antibiotic biosynthesis monooxygenase n=1 Tax=Roseateles flavus TaxID=3149041 RepID=A0ABV0G8Q1_9BURK